MKKRIVSITALLVILSVIIIWNNLEENNQYAKKRTVYGEIKNENLNYCKTTELEATSKETADNLMNGKYSNLSADRIIPIVKDCKTISKITIEEFNYLGLEKKQKETLNEQMRILNYYLGDNLENDYLFDTNTMLHYDELVKSIDDGKYKVDGSIDIPYLVYNAPNDRYKYGFVDDNLNYIWIDKGEIYGMETNPESYDPFWASDEVEQYYITDENLDDEYQLKDGRMTVREGIQFIQNYMDNELIFDTNPDTHMLVERVTVVKVTDEICAFCFRMRREYKGVVFEPGERTGENDTKYCKDHTYAYMIEKDDVDMFYGTGDRYNITDDDIKMKECVSLDGALKLVSSEVGKNSEYKIDSIELIYRQQMKNYDNNNNIIEMTEGTPCWRIYTENVNDKKKTYFYIDIADGKLSYEVGEKY